MAWLDSRIWCHPKLAKVSKSARWTYVAALAYSDGFGTLGHLERGQLRIIDCDHRDKKALIAAQLWDDDLHGGIHIRGWQDHNADRDKKRELARERQRRRRAKPDDVSREQERDKPRDEPRDIERDISVTNSVTSRARPMTGDEVTDEGQEHTAAASTKRTSSTTETHYDEERTPQEIAAAAEPPREKRILELAQRYGADTNIIEPIARNLTTETFEHVADTMNARTGSGKISNPAGLLVTLLTEADRLQRKNSIKPPPTPEEQIHAEAVQYARRGDPRNVMVELLQRRLKREKIPQAAELLEIATTAYDTTIHDIIAGEPVPSENAA